MLLFLSCQCSGFCSHLRLSTSPPFESRQFVFLSVLLALPLRVLISSSPCSSCTLSLCIIVHSLSSHLSDLFSVSLPCVWVHVSLRLHPASSPSSCVTPAENQFPVLLAFSLIDFLYSQAAWLGVSAAAFHSVSLPCSPSYSCLSCVIWLTCLKTVSVHFSC